MSITDRLTDADPLGHQLPDAMRAPELAFDLLKSTASSRSTRTAPRRRRRPKLALAAVALAAVVALAVLLNSGGSPTSRSVASLSASTSQGMPAGGADLRRSGDLVQQRLRLIGAADLSVRTAGTGRLTVTCVSCRGAQAAQLVDAVAKPGRLAIYDWEGNVLNARCKPAPLSRQVTGGPDAGEVGSLGYYEAVERAARCATARYPDMARSRSSYYAVDQAERAVLAGPAATPGTARADARAQGAKADAEVAVRRVPTGVALLKAPGDRGTSPADAGWYLLRDRPALTGRDIVNPRTTVDPSNNKINVLFGLKAQAQPVFRKLTRLEARRAPSARHITPPPGVPPFSGGHFALALDDSLLSVPYIDAVQNPRGVDPADGVQVSGGPSQDAKTIVALLRTGILPANLRPTSTSG